MNRRRSLTPLIAALLLIATVIAGCGSPAAAPAPAAPVANSMEKLSLPVDIDAATLEQIRLRDDVFVVDVREDWEYANGHVPGATLIPLGQLSTRLNEIPKDKTVVAVCRSGNRSGQATDLLRQNGFNAHNMQGGMISWEQAGLEVDR